MHIIKNTVAVYGQISPISERVAEKIQTNYQLILWKVCLFWEENVRKDDWLV